MAFGGPSQTATPLPVQDYTPTKNYPSFSGPINEFALATTYTGTANTLTAVDVMSKLLILTNAAAITAALPTAALLVPAIEGGQASLPGIAPPVGTAGSAVMLYIKAGGAGAVTVSAGTGGTLIGSGAITAGNVKIFLIVITAVSTLTATPTYNVYSLGQSAA